MLSIQKVLLVLVDAQFFCYIMNNVQYNVHLKMQHKPKIFPFCKMKSL